MKIEKILEVIDTRQYEEIDGKFRPIPGSGEVNICARCGREHEVWARVRLAGKYGEANYLKEVFVGTGCMKRSGLDMRRTNKIVRWAKELKGLKVEYEKEKKEAVEHDEAVKKINALEIPQETFLTREDGINTVIVGDGEAWLLKGRTWNGLSAAEKYERLGTARNNWRMNRFRDELGNNWQTKHLCKRTAKELKRLITKLERKLEKEIG